MDDFLQKIQNIKDQKLDELKNSLDEIQNRELDPIRREEISLKNLVKQKTEQKKVLKKSKEEFLEKSLKMGTQSAVKKELLDAFLDEYIQKLYKDSDRYKKLLLKTLEKIKEEKGTLNIDENSYSLVKGSLKDSWDIKIDNQLKGFIFDSHSISFHLTDEIVRREIYENNKTKLNKILFD